MTSQLPKHLLGLSKSELEGMCIDCSLCCYASVPLEKGNILVPDLRCRYLSFNNIGKSCCAVYQNRHEVAKDWCLSLAEAISKGVFPEQCPYVANMQDYVGSVVLSEAAFDLIEPQVRKAIMEHGKPPWMADSSWVAFSQHG